MKHFVSRIKLTLPVALLLAGLVSIPAEAQVLYGSIVGTVEDQTGAVVPNATVTITNPATGVTRETTTDEGGRYLLQNVLPGSYELKITATGFRPLTRPGVDVTINTVTRVDSRLELGPVTEAITVAATVTTLQTDKSDVRAELPTTAMTNLPMFGYRNYQSLINLVPGTTPVAYQNAVVDTPARALTFQVNGTNRNNNNTRIDGATNVFLWLPHHTLYVPPAETIETVNIATASFDAEQGLAGGAAITVVTKAGTNEFHGVTSWYHDDQRVRARNYFLRTPGKPKSINNVATGTFSGPIKKDKLFFFAGYERFMGRRGVSGNYSVPTADQREGDFSAFAVTIYDPMTGDAEGRNRTAFPGNKIPLDRQSSIIRKIQALVPLPNQPGLTLNNYAVAGGNSFDRDNYDGKLNWNPNPRHATFFKYGRMVALVSGPAALGEVGGPALGTRGTGDTKVNIATVGHTWTVSPTFLIDGTFGYTRFDQTVFGPDHGKNWGSEVWGIPGTNDPTGPRADEVLKRCPATACYSGQPAINTDYTNWGNNDGWMPLFRNDRSYIVSINASKIRGPHEIRWGYDMARHHMDHWQPEVSGGPRGVINFSGSTTALNGGTAPNYFNTYASALLGLVSNYQKAVQFLLMTNREWQFGWYFRDRWQATRKLTLNLGLRYEYYPLITRADRGIERWDPATNKVYMGGIGNNPSSVGITTSKKMFAPRLGFAYRVNDATVIRSGYGMTYDPLPFSRPLRGLYPASIGATFEADRTFGYFNRLDQGIPPIPLPDISSGILDLPRDVDMGPRSPWAGELHRGYIQSWNFTVERKLPADVVTSIAYVGTQTVHQLLDRDINAGFPGSGSTGRPLFATLGRRITTNMWDGWGSANYHSLQVAVNRQFSKGLFLKGAYTWSKAISMSDDDGWAGVGRNWGPQIGWNRARTGYDRTHMLSMGWLYELPFGANKRWASTGTAEKVLGNWQINGGFGAYTGTPFTVTASGASLNAPNNTQSADLVKPGQVQKLGGIGPGAAFYDPLAFRSVTDVRFGSTGRNILTGPGIVNVNVSLFRSFTITERVKMEFKAESFNFTNTPHFENPSTNVSNMSLNPDGTIRNLGNFLAVTGANRLGGQEAGDERQFRFGLRFSF
ncbi:MAG: TonB-dependent receptor [Acidobacteria bacterium]|nr:TonB-dependent receptor [Acidobacteriota bacterium]